MSIYDYKIKTKDGKEIKLDEYKNKVLLIVNTSKVCEFTKQYEELEDLYEKFKNKGFEILDFPCNQFNSKLLSKEENIDEIFRIKHNIKFEQFDKIDVNGENELPLYTYLKTQIPEDTVSGFRNKLLMKDLKNNNKAYKKNNDIVWNFTKFLVNREGNVIKRYAPSYKPSKMEDYIRSILKD